MQRGGGPSPCPAVDGRETVDVAGECIAAAAAKPGEPSPKSQKAGDSVQVRLRLPADFAEAILTLRADLRGRALWLAFDTRVGSAFLLRELIAGAGEVRRVGVLLNQALAYAGKNRDLEHLAPAVLEALAAIETLRPPKIKNKVP